MQRKKQSATLSQLALHFPRFPLIVSISVCYANFCVKLRVVLLRGQDLNLW